MGFKDNIPDEQLVNSLKHGDVHAFNLIFENYSSKLYIFALEYLKSKEEAEELVQEVFTTIWDRRKKLKAELSFKSYIFTIAYNIIKKRLRQRPQFRQFVDSEIIDDVCTETSKTVDYNSLKNHVAELADALP
ncbi:MAG: RNA polymerase sigma factor, partial [Bacteroidales bacterium]